MRRQRGFQVLGIRRSGRRSGGRVRALGVVAFAVAAVLGSPGAGSAQGAMTAERGAGWATDESRPQVAAAATETLAAEPSPIAAKYAATGGAAGPLGAAVGPEDCTLVGGGCVQEYEYGEIVWSAATGARALTDPDIFLAWYEAGLEEGPLGYPTSDTFCGLSNGGCGQHFQGGSIYWSWAVGDAVVVPHAIRTGWAAAGWERSVIGYPAGDAFCGLKGGGCGQHFDSGSVYWSPATGSIVVPERIRDTWAAHGWENGRLGYPSSASFNASGMATGQHFQGGSIYWHGGSTFPVTAPLRDGWAAAGWERGVGLPTGEAFCGLRNGGCGQHFTNGSVYSSPAGAFAIPTAIRELWAAQGWEHGALGYPTSGHFPAVNGSGQHFQGGSIYWAYHGRFVVAGAIRDDWAGQGWERGFLGLPVSSLFCGLRDGACGQHFQEGSIYQTRAGTFTVLGSIKTAWARQGWEHGALGFPTSDTFCGLRDGGCGQHFQGGSVYSAGPAAGSVTGWVRASAYVVPGAFRDAWAARGWEDGSLGYPLSNAYQTPGGLSQWFQRGALVLRNGRVY